MPANSCSHTHSPAHASKLAITPSLSLTRALGRPARAPQAYGAAAAAAVPEMRPVELVMLSWPLVAWRRASMLQTSPVRAKAQGASSAGQQLSGGGRSSSSSCSNSLDSVDSSSSSSSSSSSRVALFPASAPPSQPAAALSLATTPTPSLASTALPTEESPARLRASGHTDNLPAPAPTRRRADWLWPPKELMVGAAWVELIEAGECLCPPSPLKADGGGRWWELVEGAERGRF